MSNPNGLLSQKLCHYLNTLTSGRCWGFSRQNNQIVRCFAWA